MADTNAAAKRGRHWQAAGLTVVSALLYAAAFPPLGLYVLAWIALVPFLVALSWVRPLAGAGLGLVWGVSSGIGVAWWLPNMIQFFFDSSPAAAWAASLAIYLILSGVYYAAFGLWISWAIQRRAVTPLLIAVVWAGCEFARAHFLIPNPWALSAYSQAPFTMLVQAADLAGPFGIGMLIAAVNAVAAAWIVPRLCPRGLGGTTLAIAGIFVVTLVYGNVRLSQSFADGVSLRVALVQGAVDREHRFQREYRDQNFERQLELTHTAAARRPDLIFWPESSVEFLLRSEGVVREQIASVSRESGAEILVGAPDIRYRGLVREKFNSVFLFRDGSLTDNYDKVRLMPFSESDPLRGWVQGRSPVITAGRMVRPMRSRVAEIGVAICSEAMHPSHVRDLVAAGSELIANPSNDDWFREPSAVRQQLEGVAFRAVEMRRTLIRPSMTGFTAIIDPHGRIRETAAFGRPEILDATVETSHGESIYLKTGDLPTGAAMSAAALWSLLFATAGRVKP